MLTAILLGTGIAGTAYGYAEEANTDATVEMTDGTTDEFEMEPTVAVSYTHLTLPTTPYV